MNAAQTFVLLSFAPIVLAGTPSPPIVSSAIGQKIVAHARKQLSWNTTYDPSYVRLRYPNGDVPKDRGVCTDVVIRAMRSVGQDLQKLVYEDRRSLGLKTDRNIDHRRCPNLVSFFRRYGKTLAIGTSNASLRHWQPGDIVFWKLDNGRDHVGIVTDRLDTGGVPYAIHNLSTTLEGPVLTRWKIVGHYRYPGK